MRKLLALLSLGLTLNAQDRQDIELNTGQVLRSARIVAIGEKTATIAHAGGADAVPIDDVPLDVLARAYSRIQEANAKRAEKTEQAAKTAAEIQAKRDEEVKVRLAEAKAREQYAASPAGRAAAARAAQISKELAALKASVPGHSQSASQDPAVRDVIRKYAAAFAHIQPTTVAAQVSWIRQNAERDLEHNQRTAASIRSRGRESATGVAHAAAAANVEYLRAVLAHVAQFESLTK